MAEDTREGLPNSGEGTIAAGDAANTVHTVLATRADSVYAPNQIILEYDPSATVNTTPAIFDAPSGTAGGNLLNPRKTVVGLQPGEVRVYDDLDIRDFEDDVLVAADGNQDASISVYVDGKEITG